MSTEAVKMVVPEPRWKVGDKVRPLKREMRGVIVGRSYDNLLHAKEWKYKILWETGEVGSHFYCYDLREA